MASLTKRGGIWTARIFLGGRERWRSLGTRDRMEAERKARELEASVRGTQWLRRQLDELLSRACLEVLPDEAPILCSSITGALRKVLDLVPEPSRNALALELSRSLVGQQQRKLAIASGWDSWAGSANHASLPKARTLKGYEGIWKQFATWAKTEKLEWFHQFDEANALAYADHLWSQKITPRTFTAHIRFLRGVWTLLRVTAGLTTTNPWAGIKSKVAPAESGRRNLSPTELRTVIERASGSLRLLLLAGALTGARLGDIANMRWQDLDLVAGEWNLMPMKTSRTGKRLRLPLLSPLLDELRTRTRSNPEYVFPEERTLWLRVDLTKVISRHFEACGIATQEQVVKGQSRQRARVLVGFHSLRHTAATIAAKSGANLALVQKTLGHSTAGMTGHYTHTDTESAREVLRPLAEILGGG